MKATMLMLATLAACAGEKKSATQPEATPTAGDTQPKAETVSVQKVEPDAQARAEAHKAPAHCSPLEGDLAAASRALQELPKGTPWAKRQAAASKAAKAGDPEGQSIAGEMRFKDLYQGDAPDPKSASDQEAYVEALTLVFTGALRGSKRGRDFAPGMETIAESGTLPTALEGPLEEVPLKWLKLALKNAKASLECYPSTR